MGMSRRGRRINQIWAILAAVNLSVQYLPFSRVWLLFRHPTFLLCLHTAKEALLELQLLTSPQLNRSQRSYFEKWISTKNNETNNEWTNEWATHKIDSWKDEYSGTLRRGLVGNYISLDKTIINTLRQKMRARNSGTPSINNLRAVLELYIWTLTKIPIRLRCVRRHDIGEKLTALRTSRDSALRASDTLKTC